MNVYLVGGAVRDEQQWERQGGVSILRSGYGLKFAADNRKGVFEIADRCESG